ncbi:MAG: hypothetical protein FWJ68_15450, partial [Planifilum fulgidum]
RAMPPYCRGSKHQKNGLAPLEERKRLCDPPNLPNLISFICLFTINMQPLALFLRKEPGGLSSISAPHSGCFFFARKGEQCIFSSCRENLRPEGDEE